MSELAPPSPREIARRSAPAILLAAALLVPFLGKAFTVDDPVFLAEARHALSDPLHPTAFSMPWNGRVGRVSAMVPTGPVMAWILVPAVASDRPEVVAHLLELLFLCLSVVSTVALAGRLGVPGSGMMAAGLLVAAASAVLGMAGTAMPDVPAMALGVAGLQQLVAWRQDGRLRQAVAAALLLGLAPLTRTHLVLLWGVGLLFLAPARLSLRDGLREVRERPMGWAPLLAAPLITAAVSLLTRDPSLAAGSIASAAATFSSARGLPSNLLAFLVHWSVALPFAIPWSILRWREILGRPFVLLAAVAVAAILARIVRTVHTPWFVTPLAGMSAAAIVDVFVDGWKRRDSTQLALGAWLLLALPAAVYLHLPSKYLVASAPGAAILVARALVARPGLGRWTVATAVVASAALGVAILRADAAFAGLGRDAARDLVAPHVARGRAVYYTGSWGFQWYAEQAGARFFPLKPPFPRDGDLVVACLNCEPHLLPDEMEALVPVARARHGDPGGRVMDKDAGAGFYSNWWGYLPWAWGSGPVEGFDTYVVRHVR